jgi:hypothetical protein
MTFLRSVSRRGRSKKQRRQSELITKIPREKSKSEKRASAASKLEINYEQ